MKVTAQHWGNSLGFRIPAPIARDTNLTHGSQMDLQVESGRIVLTPVHQPKRFALKSLLAQVTQDNLPASNVWGAPAGKEVW